MNEKIRKKCKPIKIIADVASTIMAVASMLTLCVIIIHICFCPDEVLIEGYPENMPFVAEWILDTQNIEVSELGTCPIIAGISVSILFTVNYIILYMLIRRIVLLMKELMEGTTPFTSNVVKHLKTLSILLLLNTLVMPLIGTTVDIVLGLDIFNGISIVGVVILIVSALLTNIFEYGSEIQQEVDETI